MDNSAAAIISRPQAENYAVSDTNRGNVFERIGDWFTGYNREARINSAQSVFDKKWEADMNEYLEGTRYQRMVKDLEAAGLNPYLAISGGGSMSPGSSSVSSAEGVRVKKEKSSAGDLVAKTASSALKLAMFFKILTSLM